MRPLGERHRKVSDLPQVTQLTWSARCRDHGCNHHTTFRHEMMVELQCCRGRERNTPSCPPGNRVLWRSTVGVLGAGSAPGFFQKLLWWALGGKVRHATSRFSPMNVAPALLLLSRPKLDGKPTGVKDAFQPPAAWPRLLHPCRAAILLG